MIRRILKTLVVLAVVGAAVFWWVTRPEFVDPLEVAAFAPDAAAGEQVFYAAGCGSCHSAKDATGEDKKILSGGQGFPSPFGTFHAPNISSDKTHGIGGWSAEDLVNAMHNGVSPEGSHYFPAFPYTSYRKAEMGDIVNLHAYLMTLPADATPSKPHDVGFPFNIRRSLGGWKLLFLKDDWVVTGDLTAQEERGRYLSEALGHCGECHTPRNVLGGVQLAKWLGGAPDPSGRGNVPNITPGKLDWIEADVAEYLKSGFTPDFDTVGGHMAAVVENTSQLPAEDRDAIAAYLKKVMAVE